ncbi:MAG TPA: microviridin/marinostatin family tricyclic proteinase inhibitor [Thermoanaerobaculia bacterium]|nr:microviridin/marinostatin family tricyclic proteinase inhibitor [Thermoanaerobaculia bacterium]
MQQTTKKPFFTRFLEDQDPRQPKTAVKAGWPLVTHKWPSDNDEGETS